MDAFSYLSVLLSIIIGLAMTQILQGYRGMLLARARIILYPPTLIWSVLILLFATQSWWASFGLNDYKGWTFGTFSVILAQTIFLYMLAALILPDMPAGETIDLKAHYYREIGPFYSLTIAMLAASLLKDWMLDGRLPEPRNLAFHFAFAGLSVLALIARHRRLHEAIAPLIGLCTIAYIAALFDRL
ncbi:hypothetical protein PQ455_18380 [Sphingomonas naphthae]|uniref:Uncharacterized protein n=1 Tax=Sphingomonas naphthae TaxID=1813468 RepID=A0ABY7TJZ0_9SPHN|nr:hypothetical protein [Sphingomonas naphthae]WCT73547.1 hypothetical protein PQ455_18380 [Sphingomonas naphthae]